MDASTSPSRSPGLREREQLLRRYAGDLPFSDEAIARTATAIDGVTGSFAKELVQRAVLADTITDEPVSDAHLTHVLDEIVQSRQQLTRRMLGARETADVNGSGVLKA
ncbi:hypothetical protein [Microbacterium sp. cf332]|uniref:hypothetical protein n=1 Tax=Microbacterium sp. cf332 TaxID=1761804 RepID=UPI000B81DFC0|nr:hypothetical protein [Microbacterium sp. cf332]